MLSIAKEKGWNQTKYKKGANQYKLRPITPSIPKDTRYKSISTDIRRKFTRHFDTKTDNEKKRAKTKSKIAAANILLCFHITSNPRLFLSIIRAAAKKGRSS